jgi:xanthosine utilization system XapX-like protein
MKKTVLAMALAGILLGAVLGALLVILATAPMIAMLGSP